MSSLKEFGVLYRDGAYRAAYAVLRDLMETDPRASTIGDLYVYWAGLELIVNDDVSRARELLDRALQYKCKVMSAYYKAHGYVLWYEGARQAGIEELERSVALEPCVATWIALGRVLSCEGDSRATQVWEHVLDKEPQNCMAYVYLGILAAKIGEKDKALLMAKKAEDLQSQPSDLVEIASLYGEVGEIRTALDTYLRADRLGAEPKGPLRAAIAGCYFSLGSLAEGRSYMREALKFNPDSVYVRKTLATYRDLCDPPDSTRG